jgi:hypothetical protein
MDRPPGEDWREVEGYYLQKTSTTPIVRIQYHREQGIERE